ncbi:MAG: glycosyltransferase [Symploca sp. SIO1B1]|nr:glycosyltransferase [Symploca sp. SIO1A3]NER92647.1 glycosyltransferase [Symploca sp. SIO1B1]
MPLISVIIPAYNAEKTILETIESIFQQTFADFEIIVINDGSQDSTLELLSGVTDPRLQVFSFPNAGLSASRNRGVARAKGEYISFIDADDLWTPDKLELQLQALQTNPEAAVAYSWTDCIDEAGKFLRSGSHMSVSGDVYAQLLLVNFLESGSNVLIRQQALREIGDSDESLAAGQDRELFLRLAAKYHFVAVPQTQILYRVSAQAISANVAKAGTSRLQVIKQAFSQAPESLQYLKKISLANSCKYHTFRALEGPVAQCQARAAAKFLWCALKNDPTMIRRRVTWKVLLKILILSLLPPRQAETLLNKQPKLADVSALLIHLRVLQKF